LHKSTVHTTAQAYTKKKYIYIYMLEYLPEKAIVSLPSPDSKCTHTDHSFLLIYVSNNTVKVEEYEI